MKNWTEEMREKILLKMQAVTARNSDKIPYISYDGIYENLADRSKTFNNDDGINWWTNGFWAGIQWLLYNETEDNQYLLTARFTEEELDRCFDMFYGLHHDVGFMWQLSAVADYRLTGNAVSKKRGLHAAAMLMNRFNPVGGFLRAWNDYDKDIDKNGNKGWVIIDSMMNIPLLYWASAETGDPRFGQVARIHADTVQKNFIREDGSTKHIVEFDPFTGDYVDDYGGQGYEKGSSWTRGQGWGMYGFILSYLHTNDESYLDTALKIAGYIMSSIPRDGLIPIDFRQPETPEVYDDIAAALYASAFIELGKITGESKYTKTAEKLLKALDMRHSDWDSGRDGILTHCSGAYSSKVHVNMMYGDYYYIEAVLKLCGSDLLLW